MNQEQFTTLTPTSGINGILTPTVGLTPTTSITGTLVPTVGLTPTTSITGTLVPTVGLTPTTSITRTLTPTVKTITGTLAPTLGGFPISEPGFNAALIPGDYKTEVVIDNRLWNVDTNLRRSVDVIPYSLNATSSVYTEPPAQILPTDQVTPLVSYSPTPSSSPTMPITPSPTVSSLTTAPATAGPSSLPATPTTRITTTPLPTTPVPTTPLPTTPVPTTPVPTTPVPTTPVPTTPVPTTPVPTTPVPTTLPPIPPSAITNIVSSGVTNSGFTVTWSGGTGGKITNTFTITGNSATPTSSGANTATFTGLSAGPWALVITATNAYGVAYSQPFDVYATISSGLIVNIYNNADVASPGGFTPDYPPSDLQFFAVNRVVACGINGNFSNTGYGPGMTQYFQGGLYTASCQGYFRPNVSGTWNFQLLGDDWVWLYIGNNAYTPNMTNYSFRTSDYHTRFSYTINLTANTNYPILVLWGQSRGGVSFEFWAISPNGTNYNDLTPLLQTVAINPTFT